MNFQKSKPAPTLKLPFKFFHLFLILTFVFPAPLVQAEPLSDFEILKKVRKDTFQYFTRMSDKITGLTKDSSRPGSPASIAATGFTLAALAIGAEHGWITDEWARQTLKKTLKTLLTKAQHERGFYYHFLDPRSGRRVWGSEASSIDTALLIAGALVAAQYYPGTEIERMAHDIYKRVDWTWMLNGTDLVCMGWKPETGFLPYYWDTYNEHLIIQVLGLGAPNNALNKSAWDAWLRLEDEYESHPVIYAHSGSLFTYQYPHAFVDFRGLIDVDIDYFKNSVEATKANIKYSMNARHKFKGYADNSWGLSASVGPGGYKAYGSRPGEGIHDGTIAPYAPIGSIVFTPDEAIEAITHFYREHKDNLYGHFGFKGAFNLDKNWYSDEYLGIDQGISLLMLENYLNDGIIWKKFMQLPAVKKWMDVAEIEVLSDPVIPAV